MISASILSNGAAAETSPRDHAEWGVKFSRGAAPVTSALSRWERGRADMQITEHEEREISAGLAPPR